jgi:hypothetical protein
MLFNFPLGLPSFRLKFSSHGLVGRSELSSDMEMQFLILLCFPVVNSFMYCVANFLCGVNLVSSVLSLSSILLTTCMIRFT